MSLLNSNQLDYFAQKQLQSLHDTCRRMQHSATFNDYNEEISTWTELEDDIPCGLDQSAGNERLRDKDTLLQYDATIRLPLSLSGTFVVKDKIKITHRFTIELDTPIIYQIVSPERRGPSGVRFLLKKVDL